MEYRLMHCERCGHDWMPRKPIYPRRCAKCTALYWDRPARIPKEHKEPGPMGRPALYPQLAALEPGSECLLPWCELLNGQPDNKANAKHKPAAIAHAKRHGWKVRTEPRSKGLAVVRLA